MNSMAYAFFPKPKTAAYTNEHTEWRDFTFTEDASLHAQGYTITHTANAHAVRYGGALGRRYAEQSLAVIQAAGVAAGVVIEDAPDIENRAALIDISRGKIPTAETLCGLVSLLADMRYNEVQLYVEGYSFAFRGYEDLFPDENPLTREELRRIVEHAKNLGVTMIPNVNCLGHMEAWLSKPRFERFGELPPGTRHDWSEEGVPGTLDVNDADTLAWVKTLIDDIEDAYGDVGSPYININLDEPFELGKGKNKARCDKEGVDALYAAYAAKLNDYVNEKGKRVMMWGDVAFARAGGAALLPKNATLLDWNYESVAPFEEHAKMARDAGFRFYLCAGTSTWRSFTGRSDNARDNIGDAARTAIKYGAAGVMVTDWGDCGHLQYLPFSYIPFAIGGAVCWNAGATEAEVFAWLDGAVFMTESSFAAALYGLGNYYKEEGEPLDNSTASFYALAKGENVSEGMDAGRVADYIEAAAAKLAAFEPRCADGRLIAEEIQNGAKMAALGARLYAARAQNAAPPPALQAALDAIAAEHERLWRSRNKSRPRPIMA